MNKVVIIGNSVALRIRPPRQNENEISYAEILEEKLPDTLIINRALSDKVMPYQTAWVDELIGYHANCYILNYGIIDACTRSVPYWMWNFIYNDNPHHGVFRKLIRYIFTFFEKKFRRGLTVIRGKRAWANRAAFAYKYEKILRLLQKDTSAQLICIGINRPSARIERSLPGSVRNVQRYNEVIRQLANKYNFVYVETFYDFDESLIPDGIHFNAEGHRKLAGMLLDIIKC
ncbi:MAG: SGNH/GDSL hydrolase family protein [Bacteroidota bacterium]|nr:SGNH/GDSL hydrolase family protein [Bacteroidota bacterium]